MLSKPGTLHDTIRNGLLVVGLFLKRLHRPKANRESLSIDCECRSMHAAQVAQGIVGEAADGLPDFLHGPMGC